MDTDIATLRLQAQLTYRITPKVEATVMGAIRYQSAIYNQEKTENSNEALSYRYMPNSVIRNQNTNLYKDPNDPFALPISVLAEGGIRRIRPTPITSFLPLAIMTPSRMGFIPCLYLEALIWIMLNIPMMSIETSEYFIT